MAERTLNLKALVIALAERSRPLTKGPLSVYSRDPSFPCDLTADGRRLFNVDEVIAWLDATGRGNRAKKSAPVSESPKSPTHSNPLAHSDDEFIRQLLSGSADPVTVAEAQLALASRQYANMAMKVSIIPDSINESLVKIIARATEEKKKAIENKVRLNELIDRGTVVEVVGALTTRMVQIGDAFCTASQQQIEIWMGDTTFLAQSIEFRRREMLAWMKRQWSQIRTVESDEIMSSIKEVQSTANGDDSV